MDTYKIIFTNNSIFSCERIPNYPKHAHDYYEQNNGHLIHAFIHAGSMDEAQQKAALEIKNNTKKATTISVAA